MLTYNPDTPVLFLIFNRMDTAVQVFEKIRKASPARLYIAADGPRNAGEKIICEQVRNNITDRIDWKCEIKALFRDKNLGCRKAVTEAISWFFENEPEGIILEDDCLPSDSFFGFCSQLLEKYRHDERIGHISGSNDQGNLPRGDGSYYFSALTGIWGWAGWRRVWKDNDIELKSYPSFEKFNYLDRMGSHGPFKHYWKHKFKTHYENQALNSWDFQYAYLNLINNRLSINPNVNLTSNIGCSSTEAAHADAGNPAANRELFELDEIKHPSFIIVDHQADINAQNFEFSLPVLKESSFDGLLFLKDKLVETTRNIHAGQDAVKIPKIIHQINADREDLSELLFAAAETWKEYHPGWEYRLWNKADVDQFLKTYYPDFIPVYESYLYDIQRSYVLRYLILYTFGGLYVDMDCECVEPVDLLICGSACFVGMELQTESMYYNKQIILGNYFMGCIPGYDYFKSIIDDITINGNRQFSTYASYQIKESIGEFMLTRIYSSYPVKDEITLIPAELVNPITAIESKMLLSDMDSSETERKIENAFVVKYKL